MAATLDFDTPQSATARPVDVTGTVATNSIGYLIITLNVTNASTPTRNRSFYKVIAYDNSAGDTALAVNTSYTLAIVPKLLGSDTVTVVPAWSYVSED
ncbi:hypothetical protein [Clostridium sp.]|jgi:hypothetical protein|uniref:hypothetical protein n=1 Tax=Clostridium sp. TaxID=1506 RepID=UPI002FDD4842